MDEKIREFAGRELKKYGLTADFLLDPALPSFEIRRQNGVTVIAAPTPVELLYGVYELAQLAGGWFFFEPGHDRFDPSAKKDLPFDGVVVPARRPRLKRCGFIQEYPFRNDTADLFDWMAKNKVNYLLTWMKYYDGLSEELKEEAAIRGITIESGHHNFNYWIPWKKYGANHPEFFAENDGKRVEMGDDTSELLLSKQLCTTNPELRGEIVKNMLEYCRLHPEVKVISLIPNDGFGWCECKNCSKFYDKSVKGEFYSLSEHVYKADRIFHDLLRDVGTRLHKERPDLTLTFNAYVNYNRPSPGFRLDKGMAVHFAPYWRCVNHLIDDAECYINSHYAEDLQKWTGVKNGGEVNIYEYFMGINFYLMLPMIHFRELFHEISWYSEQGVDGIMTQFDLQHWSVYGLNYMFMARAARGADCEASLDWVFDRLFGADAPEAKNFYRAAKEVVRNTGHCHITYPRALFRRSRPEDFRKLHELACHLASGSPEDRFRRDLVLWTEYLIRFKTLFDTYQAKKLTKEDVHAFLNWIHSHRDSHVFVHHMADMYFQALLDALEKGTEWIHFNLDWEDAYIRRHDVSLGEPLKRDE